MRYNDLIYDYFHVSNNCNLQGFWKPQLLENYQEPSSKRISVSTDIIKCLQAIYPKISNDFENLNKKSLIFCVYSPVLVGNEQIIYPEELTDKKYVHDAHMTNEHWILSEVYMKKIYKIEVLNPKDKKFLYYYPFNDKNNELSPFAPETFDIKFLK